jgi:hypothetical protein
MMQVSLVGIRERERQTLAECDRYIELGDGGGYLTPARSGSQRRKNLGRVRGRAICCRLRIKEARAGKMKEAFGRAEVKKVSRDDLSKYRVTWELTPISSRKKLERMRTFFRFCEERDWTRYDSPSLYRKELPVARTK